MIFHSLLFLSFTKKAHHPMRLKYFQNYFLIQSIFLILIKFIYPSYYKNHLRFLLRRLGSVLVCLCSRIRHLHRCRSSRSL